MRSASGRLVAGVVVLVATACNGTGATPATSPSAPSTISVIPTSTLPPPVECPGGGDFEEGGGIAEAEPESTESSILGSVTWNVNDQCESFVFEFETTEGAPATSAPAIQVGHLESFQILRISLGVSASVITDQLVETDLVERLYVVRAVDGGTFVDLHLAAPAGARARVSASPATLTIDLRPGFVEFANSAEVDDSVVLLSPTSGSEVPATTQFTGYARTPESNVFLIVTQGGEVVLEATAAVADSVETWGEFRTDLDLPSGDVSVFVGEASPEDGSLDGITIDLAVS